MHMFDWNFHDFGVAFAGFILSYITGHYVGSNKDDKK